MSSKVNAHSLSLSSLPDSHGDGGNLKSSDPLLFSVYVCPYCIAPIQLRLPMKVSIPILLVSLLLTLTPLPTIAQSNVVALNRQLQEAVNRQNWSQAIQVIDQLIRVAPDQSVQLRQYRTQLQQLQRSGYQTPASSASSSNTPKVGHVLIKRRAAGVAIVDVKFNGRRTFEMMVDSGASKTVITRSMAKALGINTSHVVGTLGASTANGYVEFPIVYVSAMEVGGLKSYQVPVAVAGPDMEMGLLGQDFLQKYDFTFRGNRIEFHKR